MSLLPAAIRIAERHGASIPDDVTSFGLRAVHTDFSSSYGFRWPFPGGWAVAHSPDPANRGECPRRDGDGVCVGLTWSGMASGGISAAGPILLVGWRDEDCLTRDPTDKVRVGRACVVDVVSVAALLAERREGEALNLTDASLAGASLAGADLRRANLRRADLAGADLADAALADAYLGCADLAGANLTGAVLTGAYLTYANLAGAALAGANLAHANLTGAYLTYANLAGAALAGANLAHANLTGANLADANLAGANLTDATLTGANLAGAIGVEP